MIGQQDRGIQVIWMDHVWPKLYARILHPQRDLGEYVSMSERVEQYFIDNDIRAAEKKRDILLSVVGSSMYHLICSSTTPRKSKHRLPYSLSREMDIASLVKLAGEDAPELGRRSTDYRQPQVR